MLADAKTLSFLAYGDMSDDTVVFYTTEQPAIRHALDGLSEIFPGWPVKEIPIIKVFEVKNGQVNVFDQTLLKTKHPEITKIIDEYRGESVVNKKV